MDLLIDDERTFCECVARSYRVGMDILLHCKVGTLFIDFDLGESKIGLDVLKDAYAVDVLPKKIQIVSMNPPGRDAMAALLKDYDYNCVHGVAWIKGDIS